jgi:hypothetical protein
MLNLSLFEFMLQLRSNPRMLSRFFPDLAGKVLEPEPRNLSRELKGTPMEMTDFVVVYGFGDPLSHVVAVSFQDNLNPFAEPGWAADHENLVKLFGLTPIVLALASESAADDLNAMMGHLGPRPPRKVEPKKGGGFRD